MRYTESQKLPYPATRREMANAPVSSELLARAVDKKLTQLTVDWAAELTPSTAVLTLSSNVTGMSANTEWLLLLTTIQKQVNGSFSNQSPSAGGGAGWYHITLSTAVTCEGAVNASSRRYMRLEIRGSEDPYESELVTDAFICEEFERNGTCNLSLDVVTFLKPTDNILVWFSHTNTSSTVRMDTTNTQWAMTKICGEV